MNVLDFEIGPLFAQKIVVKPRKGASPYRAHMESDGWNKQFYVFDADDKFLLHGGLKNMGIMHRGMAFDNDKKEEVGSLLAAPVLGDKYAIHHNEQGDFIVRGFPRKMSMFRKKECVGEFEVISMFSRQYRMSLRDELDEPFFFVAFLGMIVLGEELLLN